MTNYAEDKAYNFVMDVIYIDRLFFLNLILDYLLLLCSARVCGVRLRRKRYFLAALFGAGFASASIFPALEFLLLTPVKIAAGALMALIAYGSEERLARCCIVFFAVSALFGGAVWAISMQNGGSIGSPLYISVSMPVLVLSFGVIYAILSLVFRRSMKSADISVSEVHVEFMGKAAELRALHDSGNTLFDPITGSSVLIGGADTLSPLFPEFADKFKAADCTEVLTVPELEGRLRLIPYSAVGTQSGMLAAFRPDRICIDGKERSDIIAAVSPHFVGGDGFDCIL